MIPGAALEARWSRLEPRRALPAPVLERIVDTAFPRRRVIEMQPLDQGLRNANFKLRLDSAPESMVLRIYEHDASLCRKEVDLLRLVGGSVPVPEVLYAEPRGCPDLPPFILTRYIEGISFLDLKRSGDTAAIAQAAYSAGETLAAIGRVAFPKAGWLAPGPAVTTPLFEGEDPAPRFVDQCLTSANLQRRMPVGLRERASAFMWEWAPRLACLNDQARLVHGDFSRRNLLVRRIAGRWCVAAVLDWEFAISGSPLGDLGSFLRYERTSRPLAQPHFSAGYLHAGGTLPCDWRQLARLLGLTALCESLTHGQLPDTVVTELVELVETTIDASPTFTHTAAPPWDRSTKRDAPAVNRRT
jgi:aminoglycoside phosphotransferase (APT) family kinase protein